MYFKQFPCSATTTTTSNATTAMTTSTTTSTTKTAAGWDHFIITDAMAKSQPFIFFPIVLSPNTYFFCLNYYTI